MFPGKQLNFAWLHSRRRPYKLPIDKICIWFRLKNVASDGGSWIIFWSQSKPGSKYKINLLNYAEISWILNFDCEYLKVRQICNVFFQANDSFKKRTNEFFFFCLAVLWSNCFVRFLEEFEDTKKSLQLSLQCRSGDYCTSNFRCYTMSPTTFKAFKLAVKIQFMQ